ncbi:ATP-binding protein [Agrilactobacillus fermenti]|nr:ATP-binding protein [Agrilactobacillus fermenti]
MFTRIVQNILKNAVEHVDQEGKIICSVVEFTSEVAITISNTGSLFSNDYLKQKFIPFRVNKQQDGKEHFSLGLYMSDLMIKKMKGRIILKNENEQATVSIYVKKAQVVTDPDTLTLENSGRNF